MKEQYLLNKAKSKVSSNSNTSFTLNLKNNKRLLPMNPFVNGIDSYEVYTNERGLCNKIRLTLGVNLIASNVLFNMKTEVIKDEGSNNVAFIKDDNTYISTNNFDKKLHDTRYSDSEHGYEYHCGLDIFDNHILRNKTFKTVVLPKVRYTQLANTIADVLRHTNGENVRGFLTDFSEQTTNLHLYTDDDLLSFDESIQENLIEKNGWYGFNNTSTFPTFSGDEMLCHNRVINSKNPCTFIQMYPTSDLFSFVPKYNTFRARIEKNWDYCITYPSSSTTNVPFIDSVSNGLKIYELEEITHSSSKKSIKIISLPKHGLVEGDTINLYYTVNGETSIVGGSLQVLSVDDDYVFYVYNNIDVPNEGLEEDAYRKNFSFKKTKSGYENEYYVRIFSRLPNWKYSEVLVDKYNAESIKKDCQDINHDFLNVVGKLSFAKNIYNDSLAEVVYEDDIVFDYLKDNLGRPLTSLYFTTVKTNKGYKIFESTPNAEEVEFSHCFSKVNSGFRLYPSADAMPNINIISITNENGVSGIDGINNKGNEIIFEESTDFLGDLCSFNPYLQSEQHIQFCEHRFNTVQREKGVILHTSEIAKDDFDEDGFVDFKVKSTTHNITTETKEGYCYIPHYEIPIRTFSNTISSAYPIFKPIRNLIHKEGDEYVVSTINAHNMSVGDNFSIFDGVLSKEIQCEVTDCNGRKIFEFKVLDEEGWVDENGEKVVDFTTYGKNLNTALKIYIRDYDEIPFYAYNVGGTSCRFIWRKVIANGNNTNVEEETYPYANNSLYINKLLNIYLRRQDPYGYGGLKNTKYDRDSNTIAKYTEDEYVNSEDISC